ncbi:MAG: acyltransferase family protein [Alphaproteobacteria bacterium]|nr:acyltransferase family protein [Alphaproteobacteria bacterium]
MNLSENTANLNRVEAAGGRYRADIDGLRAIAVLPVVLYHFGVAPFSGGFVGVDIFFVISGFLITQLIHAEMRESRFSIVGFYERRVRRIFPALFAVLAATAIASYVWLFPSDFKNYADSLLGTAVFGSNFVFWSEAGYFDAAATLKPLLHTWSLAVEEQFYLIFPLILFFAAKASRRVLLLIVAAIFVVSLVASIWATHKAPDSAFYLLPFRMWELLLGSLLALGEWPVPGGRAGREFAGVAGLALIGIAVFTFTGETLFPGAAALLPCVGAGLIIWSGAGGGTITAAFLSTRPMVWTGLISYSLYLWHWPLVVFARYDAFTALPAWETALLIAASIALAALSWRFVEQPFRGRHSFASRRMVFQLGGVSMAGAIAIGFAIVVLSGVPSRFDAHTRAILAVADENVNATSGCFNNPLDAIKAGKLCVVGAKNKPPSFIMWGDSHAGMLEPLVADLMAGRGRAGLYAGRNTCPPLLRVTVNKSRLCRAHNTAMLKAALDPRITDVVLTANWSRMAEGTVFGDVEAGEVRLADDETREDGIAANHPAFARGLERTISALVKAGKHVVIIASVPEIGWRVPETYAHIVATGSGFDIRPTHQAVRARQRFVNDQFERMRERYGVTVVYPDRILCANRCAIAKDGMPFYRDHHHLTLVGAELLRASVAAALADRTP